ncbi:cysteine desulfurase NifS [Candidatus Woesearchaeota archaeon]|nr:cysteine desulfurase NifS [Candidatus Woesearchaeota archaeon]
MAKKVYLDNGATTAVDKKVAEAMQPYFLQKYGNASSIHSFGKEARIALEKARETIAKKLNAEKDEIIFTSGGSESNNLAIKGVLLLDKKKNHIVTTKIEHPAVLRTCQTLEEDGFSFTYLNVDKDGLIDPKELEKAITSKTALVSIMHANNEIGVVQELKKIVEICKKKKVLFHTDAVQSFTKVDLDVKEIPVDLVSISAHKIHGPKGVGALFIRKGVELKKQNQGGHQEFDLRAGTENIPGIVGFAKAVELANDKHVAQMEKLRDYFISKVLKEIPDTFLNGSLKKRLCNNINISFRFIEGEGLLLHLDANGIAVSTGSACTSQSLEPSHVLLAIGLKHEDAHGAIRFTLSRFTTKDELDYTLRKLKEAVENLRKISPLVK